MSVVGYCDDGGYDEDVVNHNNSRSNVNVNDDGIIIIYNRIYRYDDIIYIYIYFVFMDGLSCILGTIQNT